MGQKINPSLFRLGINKSSNASWYEKFGSKQYAMNLVEDIKVMRHFASYKFQYPIGGISLERSNGKLRIIISTDRITASSLKNEEAMDKIISNLSRLIQTQVSIDIKEIKRHNINAQMLSASIALKLSSRSASSFRRVAKTAVDEVMKSGFADGVSIQISGRVGGAEIARSEVFKKGRLPRQTIRACIDNGFSEAHTKCGILGIKTAVYLATV